MIALPLAAVALVIFFVLASRNRSQPQPTPVELPEGEPDSYSATVVRIIAEGSRQELSVTRIARSGELRREEWTEQAAARALIWRPDIGKCYVLALDSREYVELDIASSANSMSQSNSADDAAAQRDALDVNSIERAFTDAPLPVSVETLLLPDQTIENHPCSVIERRATFADGQREVTRTFRARDLTGLAIRTEVESADSGIKIVTERRDIRLEVSPEEFAIPSGFKKVDKLIR